MKKTLAALSAAIALSTSAAHAAEWWWVATTSDETEQFYMDRDVRTELIGQRTVKSVWIQTHKLSGPSSSSLATKEFHRIDCVNRVSAIKSIVTYGARGEVKASWTDPKVQYEPIVPDSIGELMMWFACGAQRGAGRSEFEAHGWTFYRVGDPASDAREQWSEATERAAEISEAAGRWPPTK